MKFQYSPGLFGYGVKGADGSLGIPGFGLYFTNYNPLSDLTIIKNAIENNKILWSPIESETILPGGRTYQTGELFMDNQGWLHKINFSNLTKHYDNLNLKLSKVTYFTTDVNAVTSNDFQRYYNIYDPSVGSPKYIIDNVYSSSLIEYETTISKIYGIYPKNYARIEYSNILFSSYNPFTTYSSGEIRYEDDDKALAIVRETANNTFRIGNVSTNIRNVDLVFDVSLLKKNSTPISLNTPSEEILSNIEIGSNTLFTPVFNKNPVSFIGSSPNATSIEIEWDLFDFTPDTSITGDLYFFEKITGTPFSPLIISDVSITGNITITDLSTNAIFGYYMKITKDGWTRNSEIRTIACDGITYTMYVINPSNKIIDASASGLINDISIYSVDFSTNSIWWTSMGTAKWITIVSPTSGTPGPTEYIDVSISRNTSLSSRAGQFFIHSMTTYQTITVIQDGSVSSPYISVSPATLTYDTVGSPTGPPPYFGHTYLASFSSWDSSIVSDPNSIITSWSPHSGSGSGTISVYCNNTYVDSSCSYATISFTTGSASTNLTICRSGSITYCS